MNLESDPPFPSTGCPLASLGTAIGREELAADRRRDLLYIAGRAVHAPRPKQWMDDRASPLKRAGVGPIGSRAAEERSRVHEKVHRAASAHVAQGVAIEENPHGIAAD